MKFFPVGGYDKILMFPENPWDVQVLENSYKNETTSDPPLKESENAGPEHPNQKSGGWCF